MTPAWGNNQLDKIAPMSSFEMSIAADALAERPTLPSRYRFSGFNRCG